MNEMNRLHYFFLTIYIIPCKIE